MYRIYNQSILEPSKEEKKTKNQMKHCARNQEFQSLRMMMMITSTTPATKKKMRH